MAVVHLMGSCFTFNGIIVHGIVFYDPMLPQISYWECYSVPCYAMLYFILCELIFRSVRKIIHAHWFIICPRFYDIGPPVPVLFYRTGKI